MSDLVRYNHLRLKHLGPDDKSAFPQYPVPWFVVLDDDDLILGDGETAELAKSDFQRHRAQGVPSPEAEAVLRRKRRQRRLERHKRLERRLR